MARAKRHHYVPQFHQRFFGVGIEVERIWVYDKTTDEINLRAIKNTAVIGNYYTLPQSDGPDDTLERAFAKIEGDAAPVIDALCAADGPNFVVDVASRYVLARYLGLLHGRVPATRLASQQIAEHLASITMDTRLANREGFLKEAREIGWTGTDEELDARRIQMLERMRSGELVIKAPEQVSLNMVALGLEAVAPLIAAMGWWLLKRSTFPHYIVGDDPVTVWPSNTHSKHLGVGFGTPDAEISVPLDPETLLVMGHNVPDGYLFREEELPSVPWWYPPWPYHYRTWARAHRFVFGASRADLQAIQFMMTPKERGLSAGLQVVGGPEEWRGYAPKSGEAA
ncbi:MAG: DUF4238 domain-containing protein [Chloroflexota bacterium]